MGDWYHTCALFTDVGKIKCWGANTDGQLGRGDYGGSFALESSDMGSGLPYVDFGLNPEVVSFSTARSHTCVVFAHGKVKCFGKNDVGQLGMGDKVNRIDVNWLKMDDSTGFVDVGTNLLVTSVYTTEYSTFVMLDNGQVKSWGLNRYSDLGYGSYVHIGERNSQMGDYLPAVDFGPDRYAVRLFPVGQAAMCALLNTAELKCWGQNQHNVVGMADIAISVSLPTGKTVVSVSGRTHTIVMFDDRTMTGWGRERCLGFGSVGDGAMGNYLHEMGDNMKFINIGTGRKPVQVKVVDLATIVLLDNGDVIAFGENHYGILGNGISDPTHPHYVIGDVETEVGDNL
ncbi:regulator of chromosome condensation 1/beta-lactamase-inhibitor protein II, partial [Baffinella frigidus]